MRTWTVRALLVGGIMVVSSACATSDEWAEWRKHPTHFASGDHGFFSIRNREGQPPRVTRADINRARAEQWWGKAITVSAEQIIAE